ADSRHARKVVAGRSNQTMHPAAGGEQRVGDGQRVQLSATAAEDRRDELVVAKGCDAVLRQLLARSIVGRKLVHPFRSDRATSTSARQLPSAAIRPRLRRCRARVRPSSIDGWTVRSIPVADRFVIVVQKSRIAVTEETFVLARTARE